MLEGAEETDDDFGNAAAALPVLFVEPFDDVTPLPVAATALSAPVPFAKPPSATAAEAEVGEGAEAGSEPYVVGAADLSSTGTSASIVSISPTSSTLSSSFSSSPSVFSTAVLPTVGAVSLLSACTVLPPPPTASAC